MIVILNVIFTVISYQYLLSVDVLDAKNAIISWLHGEKTHIETKLEKNSLSSIIQTSRESNTTVDWLAGIILDTRTVQPHIWSSIIQLNCLYNVGIHIITKENIQEGIKNRDELYSSFQYDRGCAPFIFYDEQNLELNQNRTKNNRIDRISSLRDAQRVLLSRESKVKDNSVVIIADLDLYKLPSPQMIFDQIQLLKDKAYPFDAICGIGSTMNQIRKSQTNDEPKWVPFYYDTYALVFLPDTFSHPLSRRLIPHYYPGEDPRLVRSNNQIHGNFTQADIWRYFVEKGKQHPTGNVPVKSCFGGLTIFRSKVYFDKGCHYKLNETIIYEHKSDQASLMRYANNKEERPCEHVVFNDCLKQKKSFHLAVNPRLVSLWKRDVV